MVDFLWSNFCEMRIPFTLQLYRPKLQAAGGAVKGPAPDSSCVFHEPKPPLAS